MEGDYLKEKSRSHLIASLILLLLFTIIHEVSSYVGDYIAPPTSILDATGSILFTYFALLLVIPPIVFLAWNQILSKAFSAPSINYFQAISLAVLLMLLNG